MSKSALVTKLKQLPQDTLFLLIIADFYLVGLIFHAIPVTLPYMLMFTPLVLLVFGVLGVYPLIQERRQRIWIWAAVTYLITLSLEIIGVHTGKVFGAYYYGDVLGLKLADVPLVIGFNWVIVVLGAARFSERITGSPLLTALLVGGICVVYDFALEPVAIGLNYWQWTAGHIPLQNYAAWFLIAAVAGWAYRRMGLTAETRLPEWYVGVQFIFFIGLQLLVV
ncbi:MAG: carotenoid biosynthesis protein [Spirochaetota bacterium]